jgi:hypothetical protein
MIACQVVAALTWLWLCWKFEWSPGMCRVQRVVAAALLIGLAGVVIDQATLYRQDLAAALMRYYWFRMSDALLPVGLALLLIEGNVRLFEKKMPRNGDLVLIALVLLAGLNLADVCRLKSVNRLPPGVAGPRSASRPTLHFFPSAAPTSDESPPALDQPNAITESERLHGAPPPAPLAAVARDWMLTCQWIRENTDADARFLTPRAKQTFKWYAQRPEVVSWKDVPQDARGLVAWFDTWNAVQPRETAAYDLCGFSDNELRALAARYNADYLVIDRTRSRRAITFPRVYPEEAWASSYFEVYRVPPRNRPQ